MNGNPYHGMKILKHLDRIEAASNGRMCPVFLQLDLTNKCNFNCKHCSSKMYGEYNKHNAAELDPMKVLGILDDAKKMGVKAIEITGGGEPTLHPDFVDIMREVRRDFEFALVTNGSTLQNDKIKESLVGAAWIRLSIDAALDNTHQQVHKAKKDIYLANIIQAAKEFKIMSPSTVMGFSFIVTNDNYSEILDAANLAKCSNFDNIRFSSYYSPSCSMIEDSNIEEITDALYEVEERETDKFRIFTFKERVKEIYDEKRTKLCYYSCIVGIIAATGLVYPCCAMKNMSRHKMGDIYEDTLMDIFTGRDLIMTKACPPCWMNAKNESVEYILEPQLHSNFP